ncbi:MAG: hypothetical protein ABIY55_35585, partial [Kofleriaceae bacterium]
DANVVDGANVNFDLAAGFAPVTHTLTANGTIAGAQLGFRDIHGAISSIDREMAPFNAFRAIPAERLGSGLNRLSVSGPDGTSVIRYFKDPVDQNVTFPVALQLAQQPTATAVPYPMVHFMLPTRIDGSDYFFNISSRAPTTTIFHTCFVSMTSAWREKASAGAATFAYVMPDFHGLAGWHSGFQLEAGMPLDWSVSVTKSKNFAWGPSVAPGTFLDRDGTEFQTASASGQLAMP